MFGRLQIIIIIFFLMFFHSKDSLAAYQYFNKTILPKWCMYTQGQKYNHPKSQQYRKRVGPAWHHMHHYCYGLDEVNRAFHHMDNEFYYKSRLGYAIKEFDYILQRSDSNCPLKPQILLQKGTVLLLLQKDIEAVRCFFEAIEIRPAYTPAYVSLGNYYMNNGDKERARNIIGRGLKFAPDSDFLKKMLAELGG